MYTNYSTSILLLTNVDLKKIEKSEHAIDALDQEDLSNISLDAFLPAVQERIKECHFVIFLGYDRFKVIKTTENFDLKTEKSQPMRVLEQVITRINLFLSQMNSW